MSDADLSDWTTTVCRHCGSADIEVRSPARRYADAVSNPGWHCRECDARFDEPTERLRDRNCREGKPRGGLAAALYAADPEEVGADD